ncbi:hypothetical protein [Microbacterium aurum]
MSILRVIGKGLAGMFKLGIAGLVAGIALDIFGFLIYTDLIGFRSSSFHLFVFGLAAGLVGGMIVEIFRQVSERAKKDKAARDAAQYARESKASQLKADLNRLSSDVIAACDQSVDAFEQLPTDLSNARSWLSEARTHFANTAYSPFWHAIEQAYVCLGVYNQRIATIDQLSHRYMSAARDYQARGGRDVLPIFPVQLDAAKAADAAQGTSVHLGRLVYEAQRDPVFAQIWEQRRTTAAVVAGFANLEAAVDRMSGTLNASLGSLSSSVQSLSSEVSGMGAELRDASARADAIGIAQLATQQQLNDRMNKAVFYLREEHKRAIGLL